MIEYAFLRNHLRGGPLVVLTLSLVVFAVHVPMLVGFTVARYYARDSRRRYGVWPPAALEFLRELEDNNDSRLVQGQPPALRRAPGAPARELAERLSDLGEPHYFRPYNNLRFRPGPPIKEHTRRRHRLGAAGGFYFHLSLDGLIVAAGLFRPAPRPARALPGGDRRRSPGQGVRTRPVPAESAGLALIEPELKRAPRGYPRTIRASTGCA